MHQENFLKYLELEKRYSPHTLTAYRNDLEEFFSYLSSAYGMISLAEIQHGMIRSWMVTLMEQNIVARSINRKLSTLRSFYKYLLRHGEVKQNPMLKIQPPKNSKKLPVFVEKEKMKLLFDEVHFDNDFESLRNKLILEMFYSTGMRLAELIGLQTNDIDLHEGVLKVLGKRNKERIIPFPRPLKKVIQSYLKAREMEVKEIGSTQFFVNSSGKKLYPKLVYRIVVKYIEMVSTLDKKSPHVLRHTFATHMLNNGADINAIKELLGHANLSATQVYTHNTIEKLKNIHQQAHPKA